MLSVIKGAIEALAGHAGHDIAETDPELGANLMMFFFRDWDELTGVRDLDQLIPDLSNTVARLKAAEATQYRAFRCDDAGAIQAACVFVRVGGGVEDQPADAIALNQAVMTILDWAPGAFADHTPLVVDPMNQTTILRPDIANLIRAAYDPVMPVSGRDPSHALRLLARLQG